MDDHHNSRGRVEAAADLTAALLGARRRVTCQPSDPYVSMLGRDLVRERVKPCAMIAAWALTAIRDGAPRGDVERFGHTYLALVGAQYPAPSPRPLDVLHRVEARHDAALDLAQMRALTEQSLGAQRELYERVLDYERFLPEFRHTIEHELFRVAA